MVRRKGERTKRIAQREFPHGVEIEIPPRGLGEQLNALHRWCHEHAGRDAYATTGRMDGMRDFVVFRFRDDQAAAAFRDHVDELELRRPPFSRRTFT